MIKLVMYCFILSVLCGCASMQKFYLSPVQSEKVVIDKFYIDGKEHRVGAVKGDSFFLVSNLTDNGRYLVLNLFIVNTSDKRIDVLPENVEAFSFSDEGEMRTLKVFDGEDLLKKARGFQAVGMTLKSFSSRLQSNTAHGTYRNHTSGERGSFDIELPQQNKDRQLALETQELEDANNLFKKRCLKNTTLLSGEEVGGDIFIQRSFSKLYEVHFELDGNVYVIQFKRDSV